ncbi:hypothetical protein Efla_002398 [Eimeria flavescens]
MKHVDHILNERAILLRLEHPLTVRCFGTFQDPRYLYLVMEFVQGGEFFTHLRKAKRFDSDTAKFYAAMIVDIFDYLHADNIIYRDLKPENMLLDRDGYVKLTDFGFAKVVELRTDTLCGTPEYIAPEVLLNKGHGKPVDWWTLGILIYEMIVGYPPFLDDDPLGIYQKILSGKYVFPKFFDKDAKLLVRKLLQADLSKRWGNLKDGVQDIKGCRWFSTVDFAEIRAKKIPAQFKPTIKCKTGKVDIRSDWRVRLKGRHSITKTVQTQLEKRRRRRVKLRVLSRRKRRLATNRPCERSVHIVVKQLAAALFSKGLEPAEKPFGEIKKYPERESSCESEALTAFLSKTAESSASRTEHTPCSHQMPRNTAAVLQKRCMRRDFKVAVAEGKSQQESFEPTQLRGFMSLI